ncbi:MAG: hypothetical protein EAY75_00065 [Bacteroidetes bacterium]|nr:MAG: hypothetical protein EAY75_00065 [Bacteroidota bacterium]
MSILLENTLYNYLLADYFDPLIGVDLGVVNNVYDFFAREPLFNWHLTHNFCEARAEAMSLLLDAWKVPHVKSWVFGAPFLYEGYVGGLKCNWNYHVAVAIPVLHDGGHSGGSHAESVSVDELG